MGKRKCDFTKETKEILAKRVAYRCSNPDCRCITVGSNSKLDKATLIGDAAHIKAAQPGGARYDNEISDEERKSISNGIWLCKNCAKMIDDDPSRYTVELLKAWKEKAEVETQMEVEKKKKIEEKQSKSLAKQMKLHSKETKDESIPQELEFDYKNVYEKDIENRVSTIIQKINNNEYEHILIFKIIEIFLRCDQYTERNYLNDNKEVLKDFIKNNQTIIKRQEEWYVDDGRIKQMFEQFGPDNIEIVIDLMHVLDKRNAEIAFEDFKKNLEAFKMPIFKDYEELLTVEFLNKVIALPHEEIIKNAIGSKRYYEYIYIIETLFYDYKPGDYFDPKASEEIKKYVEILNAIISDNGIDKCARNQFKRFKEEIEKRLF